MEFTGILRRRVAQWFARPENIQQQNVRSVQIDGIGVGLVSGVATFLSVFLVRLGASPFLVGMLTSMPALTGMLLAIPVGRFLERQRNAVPTYSRSRVWVQASYAVTGLIPFFLPPQYATIAIIAVWAIATVPQTIVNISFTVVMNAVAGPRQRQYLMSRRWSVLGITTAISVVLVGAILDWISFPLNYQLVFIASFAGGMLSFAFSRRIVIPDNPPPAEMPSAQISLRERLRDATVAFRENKPFGHFVLSAFVFNLGMMLALPLFPLYWVRVLHASDFWIGMINTVNNGVLLVAYFAWAAISRRYGNVLVLRICAVGLASYPLLTGLSESVPPLALYAGLAGIFGAGLNLVMFDISLSTCPPERIASYIALYQMVSYTATLIAPMIGTFLAGQIGYSPALFLSAGLRFAGAVLFIVLGVGAVGAAARLRDRT